MSTPLPGVPEPEYTPLGEWDTQLEVGGEVFPFCEDEDANITGVGHQDRAAFADAINRYDGECGITYDGSEDLWTAEDIDHDWVAFDAGSDELMHRCTTDTPGAFRVTTLWGQR